MTDRSESTPSILTAALVFGSVAVWSAAFLATWVGSLSAWVSGLALLAGVIVGVLAARQCRVARPEPLDDAGEAGGGLLATIQTLPLVDVVVLALFAAVSLRQFGWLLFERGGLLETLLANNYGDLPLHWTYVRYLAGGAPFWPDNPIISGERLRYPFGVDLLTAVFVSLGAGMRVVLPAMGLVGAGLAAVALRRWGGALAVAGLLFSGGLAGFPVLWTGQLVDYQDAVAWKNLFLALFVPQRGLLLALPVGLLLLWSWRRRLLRGERGAAAVGRRACCGGRCPSCTCTRSSWSRCCARCGPSAAGACTSAWTSLAWALGPGDLGRLAGERRLPSGGARGLGAGLDDRRRAAPRLPARELRSVPPAGTGGAGAGRARAGSGEELLILGPALAIFALLFVVRLAPWAWDNTKVMLWCYLLALPPIGALVLAPLGKWWRWAAVGGLLFSGAVSVAAASVGGGPRLDVLDLEEYPAVCEALASQSPRARVAVAPTFNHPVALCGHPLVMGYGGHLWSHGIDGSRVQAHLRTS